MVLGWLTIQAWIVYCITMAWIIDNAGMDGL
jgi:hypothetical protein